MNFFLNIQTVFDTDEDRTIRQLEKVYLDAGLLKDRLHKITSSHLTTDAIKGKKMLLKPNWVKHDNRTTDSLCLRTNDQFLLAALEVILEKKPAEVIIGDAPIQGGDWDRMVSRDFIKTAERIGKHYHVPVKIKDFRRAIFNPAKNNPVSERNPLSDYVIFDVGKESYLEPITNDNSRFRVTCYNPDRLMDSHSSGVHKYCVTKELFKADVVVSLPKIKTHQKTGITAALKNLVGINGDKDFLPHHRMGGTGFGGDCYPGRNYLRYWSELSLDMANRRQGKLSFRSWSKFSSLLWRLSCPGNEHQIAAGWHGNDTIWRMVLDLNKIAIYGKMDGTLSKEPQRHIFSLCDGIIGGQGNGPLEPVPLPLGIICFSNHSFLTDVALGKLMNFDILKIPMLSAASALLNSGDFELMMNSRAIQLNELNAFAIKTIPPPGWVRVLNGDRK